MAKRWQRVLAGDVGGTKTWLALYAFGPEGELECLADAKVPSAEHPSLLSAIRRFAEDCGQSLDGLRAAAFGIAGPVSGRRAVTTNLPWIVDADALGGSLAVPAVGLLNDFEAVARGISEVDPGRLPVLADGSVDPAGARLIVGAGTGLGVAVALPDGPVLASEGGHLAFAPRDEFEVELRGWLRRDHDRVSIERVVSGPGLERIYEFVVERGHATSSPEVREAVRAGGARAIAAHAGADPGAQLALERFVGAYGAAAGELALAVIPTGGLYVAGGIAPQLHASMREPTFAEAFVRGLLPKGRMRPLMERVRVVLVDDPRVGLLGARREALRLLGAERRSAG